MTQEEQIEDLRDTVKRLHKEVMEYIQTEKVMIAAGLISEEKVKQAHEIVQKF